MTRLTQEESDFIEDRLEQIYSNLFPGMNDRNQVQVREYIDVAEYGIALDNMAHILLENGKLVTSDLRRLFAEAADKMNIKPGDGYPGVDRLRTSM